MQKTLMEHLRESELAQQWRAVETAATLEAMRAAAWVLARGLGLLLMRQMLEARAAQPTSWPGCEGCGKRLQSKGWAVRPWTGVVGRLGWKRRVGRGPSGCKLGQVAPLDRALGLQGYARLRVALQACLACWRG
jgi:hypothetical protein